MNDSLPAIYFLLYIYTELAPKLTGYIYIYTELAPKLTGTASAAPSVLGRALV